MNTKPRPKPAFSRPLQAIAKLACFALLISTSLRVFSDDDKTIRQIETSFTLIQRAIRDVKEGKLDFFYPVLCDESRGEDTGVRNGSESLGYIPMGIYSLRSNPKTKDDLLQGNYHFTPRSAVLLQLTFSKHEIDILAQLTQTFSDASLFLEKARTVLNREFTEEEESLLLRSVYQYVVETIPSHLKYLGAPASTSSSIPNSIHKLLRGRIDAYVNAPLQVDSLLNANPESHKVFRAVHSIHFGCYVVSRSERGELVDKILQKGVKTIKSNGAYDKIFGALDEKERAWVEKYQ